VCNLDFKSTEGEDLAAKSKKGSLFVVFFTIFIDLVGFGIIIPLSPYIATKFQASSFEVGLLMSVFSLLQFIAAPFWGSLSDRIGRRPVMLTSIVGIFLSYLMFAFSQTLTGLFVSRVLAGLFSANISTATAIIADLTEENERSKNMGLVGAAFGLGFVFGPAIGGFLTLAGENFGSQPPFGMSFAALGAGIIALINFGLAFFLLPETNRRILALKEKSPSSLESPHNSISSKFRLRDHRWNLITTSLKTPVLGSLLIIFFLASLAMAHMESTLGLFVKEDRGWGVSDASFAFTYVGVCMVVMQGFLIRKLMPKFGERNLLASGLILAALGLMTLGYSTHIGFLVLSITALAFGTGMVNPCVLGGISIIAKSNVQGGVMGATHSLSALGRILGPVFGGWLYGAVGKTSPFLIGGGLMLVALAIVVANWGTMPSKGKNP